MRIDLCSCHGVCGVLNSPIPVLQMRQSCDEGIFWNSTHPDSPMHLAGMQRIGHRLHFFHLRSSSLLISESLSIDEPIHALHHSLVNETQVPNSSCWGEQSIATREKGDPLAVFIPTHRTSPDHSHCSQRVHSHWDWKKRRRQQHHHTPRGQACVGQARHGRRYSSHLWDPRGCDGIQVTGSTVAENNRVVYRTKLPLGGLKDSPISPHPMKQGFNGFCWK